LEHYAANARPTRDKRKTRESGARTRSLATSVRDARPMATHIDEVAGARQDRLRGTNMQQR
jgi:hypothetical protein